MADIGGREQAPHPLFGLNANNMDQQIEDIGVGFAELSAVDPMGGQMQYSLWYPSKDPNGIVKTGPYEFPGTRDAEPAPGRFGLVILSHGSGGSDMSHRDTALALVKAGFIAAAPLHPRNSLGEMGDDQRIVLDGRPRQLSAVIDALLAQPTWSSRINTEKIAAFGFSAGGYAVLAALGAVPEYYRILDHCERHADDDPYCRIVNDVSAEEGNARAKSYVEPAQPTHDERFRAAVIADPFAAPFSDAALKALPPAKLLFFRPEIENVLRAEFHVSRVVRILTERDGFPDPQEIMLPNAHHLSFIAPVPESIGKTLTEPGNFDREGFREEMDRRTVLHEEMNKTIVTFLQQFLSEPAGL